MASSNNMERQKRKFCGADSHNGSGSGHLLHVNEHEDEHEDAQSSGEDDDALDRNEYIPSNSESSSADCDDSSDEDFCEKKESAASSLSVKRQKREMENINGDDSESSTNSESETMPSLVAKSKKSVHLKSKSAIAKIVKNCSEKEAKQLLVNLASVSKKAKAMIADFRPEKMPMGVPPLDHWALHCLFCESERNLVPLQDIKVCTTCDKSINDPSGKYPGVIVRSRVHQLFPGFSPKELREITHQKTPGRQGKYYYVYKFSTVLAAAKKKWGSLYLMKKRGM